MLLTKHLSLRVGLLVAALIELVYKCYKKINNY